MTEFLRFEKYDAHELRTCGEAFTTMLANHGNVLNRDVWQSSAKPWTDLVLNWFSSVQHASAVVDTSAPSMDSAQWGSLAVDLPEGCRAARSGTGEFLKIDLLASMGPQYQLSGGYWNSKYWQELLNAKRLEVLLALESEWKGGSAEARYSCVMHSAAKLASVRAKIKTLVFASGCSNGALDSRERWLKDVSALRELIGDDVAWLVVDVPWGNWAKTKPFYEVLERRPGAL